MNKTGNALKLHSQLNGKIYVASKFKFLHRWNFRKITGLHLSKVIEFLQQNPEEAFNYTTKGNTVGLISNGSGFSPDGTAAPAAALSVLESLSLLIKKKTDVNAIPLAVSTQEKTELIKIATNLENNYFALVVSNFKKPSPFELEKTLKTKLNIPVISITQDCMAISVLAALINSCRLNKKKIKELKILIAGSASEVYGTASLLAHAGIHEIYLCVDNHCLTKENAKNLSPEIQLLQEKPQIKMFKTKVEWDEAAAGCDAFIGLKGSPEIKASFIKNMSVEPWILALNSPKPNITMLGAKSAGVRIYCTRYATKKNLVNQYLSLPGLIKVMQSQKITVLTPELKMRAAYGIANCLNPEKIKSSKILPRPLNQKIVENISYEINKTVEEKNVSG